MMHMAAGAFWILVAVNVVSDLIWFGVGYHWGKKNRVES